MDASGGSPLQEMKWCEDSVVDRRFVIAWGFRSFED